MIKAQTTSRRTGSGRSLALRRLRPAALVAGAYALAGTIWIIVSDQVFGVVILAEDPLLASTVKGVGFVAVTSGALYLVLDRVLRDLKNRARVQVSLAAGVRDRAREQRQLTHRLMQAEEDTRRAVAKDLHDSALQTLTLTFMQLDAALRAAEDGGAVDVERVSSAMTAIRSASDEIRGVVRALHPPLLAELGLAAAVERHCVESARRSDREVVFHGEQAFPPVEEQTAIAVFRIVQEALSNALRHTRDGAIEVDLHPEGSNLHLAITDGGPGFRPAQVSGLGLGLVSMRERAESVGGSFLLESSPAGGTRIHVRIPFRVDA